MIAGVAIAGVVLNRVASERHRAFAADAIAAIGIPVFGAIPRDENLGLLSRHLGLVQAREHPDWKAGSTVSRRPSSGMSILTGCSRLSAPLNAASAEDQPAHAAPGKPHRRRIRRGLRLHVSASPLGLAKGRSRNRAVLAACRRGAAGGLRLLLAARRLPELHAGKLAAARRFHEGLRRLAEAHPVHGECGGYMVLGAGLEDAGGARHAMVGLLGHSTSFARRRLTLGYRRGMLRTSSPIGVAGGSVRGHEFRYSVMLDAGGDEALLDLFDAQSHALGPAGGRRGHVSGTYFHVIAAGQGDAW